MEIISELRVGFQDFNLSGTIFFFFFCDCHQYAWWTSLGWVGEKFNYHYLLL